MEDLECLNFDNPTLDETELHQDMAEAIEFSDMYEKKEKRARLKHPENYDSLLVAYMDSDINLTSPNSEDITLMRRHIVNILGFPKLQGHGGEKILVVDAKPSRITKMYNEYIHRAESIQ